LLEDGEGDEADPLVVLDWLGVAPFAGDATAMAARCSAVVRE